MLRLVALAFLACGLCKAADEDATLLVPSVSLNSLLRGGPVVPVRSALEALGILAIEGVPELETIRQKTAIAAKACLREDGARHGTHHALFPDGSSRVSVALHSSLQKGEDDAVSSESWGSLEKLDVACGEFEAALEELRALVKVVEVALIRNANGSFPLESAIQRKGFEENISSIEDLVKHGETLEHYHVYRKVSRIDAGNVADALTLHKDAGLFILFIPAVGFPGTAADGFKIQNPEGRVVRPKFPNDGNVVVLMLGASFEALVGPKAVPHALSIGPGITRAWYGKMFLPPNDTLLRDGVGTFGELQRDFKSRQSNLCGSATFNIVGEQSNSCAEDELFCWMQCMKKPNNCALSDKIECTSSDGTPWNEKDHCMDCLPRCSASKNSSKGKFCNGMGTTMYMDRVHILAGPEDACVVLLFVMLDTPVKFIVGMAVVFVFGVMIEGGHWLKRGLSKDSPKIAFIAIHFLQLTAAYIAMLFAMTMSIPIMLSVVAGLVTGHFSFNFGSLSNKTRVQEPCCEFTSEDEISTPLLA